MHLCQLPLPLQPGDLLYVITPSGTLRDREREAFEQGLEIWRSRGYRVELGCGFDQQWGYLAGKDEQRRQQLVMALKDPGCRGLLCLRGGFGGARLLEDWNWVPEQLEDRKWLIGFSDITNLLWSLSNQGTSGVHGPVLTTLAAEPDWSRQRLFALVERHELQPLQGKGWGGRQAQGILLPGNLTVATHLLGTRLQPEFTDVILAIEDVSEVPYRIDRMLTQWRLSGVFQKLRGIALGRFSQCQAPAGIPSLAVEEVLRDRLSDLGIPIVSDLPFGHDGANAALPVGVWAQLDAATGRLSFG
jgi:muramoyltetrapeptide carboxypeptidase